MDGMAAAVQMHARNVAAHIAWEREQTDKRHTQAQQRPQPQPQPAAPRHQAQQPGQPAAALRQRAS